VKAYWQLKLWVWAAGKTHPWSLMHNNEGQVVLYMDKLTPEPGDKTMSVMKVGVATYRVSQKTCPPIMGTL
jgi:hypothetical protein